MDNTIKPLSISGVSETAGLSADVDKLPTNAATGSTFYCIDTQEVYMFEETTKTWYKQ